MDKLHRHIELSASTQYGLEESVVSPEDIVDFAIRDGAPAVAITDKGSVWAFPEFYRAAKKAGIKPIYGLWICNDSPYEPMTSATLIAKNRAGMKNLHFLFEIANNCECSLADIFAQRDGLFIGEELDGNKLLALFQEYQTLGRDTWMTGFFINWQYDYLALGPVSRCIAEEKLSEKVRSEFYEFLNILIETAPLTIAVSGANCITEEDALGRDILLHKRMFYPEGDQPDYMLTAEELLKEWIPIVGDTKARALVITNPAKLADEIEIFPSIPEERPRIGFTIPDAERALRAKVTEAAQKLFGDILPAPVRNQLEKEFGLLKTKEDASYLLLVSRLAEKLEAAGIPHGTGITAGGSLIANLLGITTVSPLPFNAAGRENAASNESPALPAEYFFRTSLKIDLLVPNEFLEEAYQIMKKEVYGDSFAVLSGIRPRNLQQAEELLLQEESRIGHPLESNLRGRLKQRLAAACGTLMSKPFPSMILPYEDDSDYGPILFSEGEDESGITAYSCDEIRLKRQNILPDRQLSLLLQYQQATGKPYRDIQPSFDILMQSCDVWSCSELPEEFADAPEILGRIPQGYSDLLTVYGLKHGTGAAAAAKRYFETGGQGISPDAPAFREDVYLFLLEHGLSSEDALHFAEMAHTDRAGQMTKEQEALLLQHRVPQYYVQALKEIHYLYSKARAIDIIDNVLRLCWYRRHYPDLIPEDTAPQWAQRNAYSTVEEPTKDYEFDHDSTGKDRYDLYLF